MRQISAQKDARVLLAKRYGRGDDVSSDQLASHGEQVESHEQHDMKAVLAPQEVETTVTKHLSPDEDPQEISTVADTDRDGTISNSERDAMLGQLKNALQNAFIVTYAQGMSLLQVASIEMKYGIDLTETARIWRGGCIIRSALLEEMRRAYSNDPKLASLLLDEKFANVLSSNEHDWRAVIEKFSTARVPAACFSSTLAYFDAFTSERLPANLIQAQRDYFGAHTYQRVDKEGIFHTPDWGAGS